MLSEDVGYDSPVTSTEAAANVIRDADFVRKTAGFEAVRGACKLGEATVESFVIGVLSVSAEAILTEDVGDDDVAALYIA